MVDSIASASNLSRIKNNVRTMVGKNAPEADIDAYLAEEGVTVDQVRNFRPSVGEDMLRSAPSGLKRGTESLVGTAEDTGSLGGRVIGKVASWLGFDPEKAKTIGAGTGTAISDALNPIGGVSKIVRDVGGPDLTHLYAPSSQTAHEDVNEYVPGASSVDYSPQTRAGKFVHTGAEFVPGAIAGPLNPRALLTRGAQQFGVGLASEGAGQLTEGTAYEPLARVGTGLGAALLMHGLGQRNEPTAQAQRTMDEGIDLSAGQATGNPTLKFAESSLGGNTTQALIDRQRNQLTSRAMETFGAPEGSLATAPEMRRELTRIGGNFQRVAQVAGDVPISPQQQSGIVNAVVRYQDLVGPGNQAPIVERMMNDIGSLAPGGTIRGDQYGVIRSQLGEAIREADHSTSTALRAIQDQLDDAVETHLRQVNPQEAGVLADARRQYRLYLDMERAVANEPIQIAGQGQVTPASLRGGVKGVEGNRRLVTGESEFVDLANDAGVAMSQMPQSGTANRAQTLAAAGLAMSGNPVAAASTVLGPWLAGKGLMSRPVQNYLMSAPEEARAMLTAIIAANQGRKGPR